MGPNAFDDWIWARIFPEFLSDLACFKNLVVGSILNLVNVCVFLYKAKVHLNILFNC